MITNDDLFLELFEGGRWFMFPNAFLPLGFEKAMYLAFVLAHIRKCRAASGGGWDDWYYLSVAQLEEAHGGTAPTQRRVLRALETEGFIELQNMGDRAKRHIRINKNALADLLRKSLEEENSRRYLASTSNAGAPEQENSRRRSPSTGRRRSPSCNENVSNENVHDVSKDDESSLLTVAKDATESSAKQKPRNKNPQGGLLSPKQKRKAKASTGQSPLATEAARRLHKVLKKHNSARQLVKAENIAKEFDAMLLAGACTEDELKAAVKYAHEHYGEQFCHGARSRNQLQAAVQSWAKAAKFEKASGPEKTKELHELALKSLNGETRDLEREAALERAKQKLIDDGVI